MKGFRKSAGKSVLRDAVADVKDLAELLYVDKNYGGWGSSPNDVQNIGGREYSVPEFQARQSMQQDFTGSEFRITMTSDRNGAEASRLVVHEIKKPLNFLTGRIDTVTVELTIKKPDARGHFEERSLARLVLRLDEEYDAEKLKNGTLKGRILSYMVNGVAQDVSKPVDLKPMLGYDREMAQGRLPVAVPRQNGDGTAKPRGALRLRKLPDDGIVKRLTIKGRR